MATTTISSLIDFLLALLGDEELQAEFQQDPEGVLAKYGLDSTCGLDIRDVQPMVADHVGVQATGGPPHFANSDDALPEISVITKHYVVHEGPDINNYNYYYVDDEDIIINVDDRDTVDIHAEGDLTITDSFNEDNDITVIDDSFNQDNDGIDNKGGSIDHSTAAGDDIDSSLNSDSDTSLSGSENTTVTETNTDASTDTTVDASYNHNTSDDDLIDTDVSVEGVSGQAAPTAVHEADSLWPQEDADAAVGLDPADAVSQ
ncbi:IniB N-terminal domain-containing protein [Actinophytocola sp.]|uniref:IniB N-terminal domain-containing protein n=1 Tax=Actinophytocola sp. TaxID=1872138 RepID=UPI003D6B1159